MSNINITDFQKKQDLPKLEHEVLKFWDETQAFAKSVAQRDPKNAYVFYDGPPFATGLPHYGHILASTIKDVVPRYWTMKGYRVERIWGWDCHGIPIENMIEQELGLKGGKKGIEELGIDKFNAACRAAILRFDNEWEKVVRRIGRWVDFKNSYKTMDKTYMESVWWAFKTLSEKGMVYEGRKVILYCPRCSTPLSNFEIAMDNSYKEVADYSVYVKFKVKNKDNEYLVAWTTTPWTLVGNVALAVDPRAVYIKVKSGNEYIWLAEKRLNEVFNEKVAEVERVEKVTGKDLVNFEYEPLYEYMPPEGKKAFYVTDGDFVSLEEGTGIVHTAAIFGEDDYRLAVEKDLPRVPTLDDQGKFLEFVKPLAGIFYKKAEDWIVQNLTQRNLIMKSTKSQHSYPFCYRCETPLYYNAIPAWFINVQKLKSELANQNENINWYPKYLKQGRFGKGLVTAPDWNISRSRYWGTPMPVWESSAVSHQSSEKKVKRIIGSLEELKEWAVETEKVEELTDIHREFLDDLEVWVDDARTIKGKRIAEVFDCWVESGSMPYASIHYPFENKQKFESSHPAQFIAEYIAQTRAWFYTLHVMSVALFGKHTFENAVTTGTIMAEDGSKMSKSKKNFPDPSQLFEIYGVDALRFYLMGSVVMKAENVNFSEVAVKEIYQKVFSILWNTFSFYKLYAKDLVVPDDLPHLSDVLDRWIVSKTNSLIKQVTKSMDSYDTIGSCRAIADFITDLSTWYLRRSRERFKENPDLMPIFGWVLKQLVLVMAPITPFISELIYQNLVGGDSVHLANWPKINQKSKLITAKAGSRQTNILNEGGKNQKLERDMEIARKIAALAHASRKLNNIKVRIPLKQLTYATAEPLDFEIEQIIADETNVKEVKHHTSGVKPAEPVVTLDMNLYPELEQEGEIRELIRQIQDLRKEAGLKVDAVVKLELPEQYKNLSKNLLGDVKRKALVESVVWGKTLKLLTG